MASNNPTYENRMLTIQKEMGGQLSETFRRIGKIHDECIGDLEKSKRKINAENAKLGVEKASLETEKAEFKKKQEVDLERLRRFEKYEADKEEEFRILGDQLKQSKAVVAEQEKNTLKLRDEFKQYEERQKKDLAQKESELNSREKMISKNEQRVKEKEEVLIETERKLYENTKACELKMRHLDNMESDLKRSKTALDERRDNVLLQTQSELAKKENQFQVDREALERKNQEWQDKVGELETMVELNKIELDTAWDDLRETKKRLEEALSSTRRRNAETEWIPIQDYIRKIVEEYQEDASVVKVKNQLEKTDKMVKVLFKDTEVLIKVNYTYCAEAAFSFRVDGFQTEPEPFAEGNGRDKLDALAVLTRAISSKLLEAHKSDGGQQRFSSTASMMGS